MPRRRLFLVELFAGSHSVSRCVRRRFGESFDVRVLSVDNDPVSNPTILAAINEWQYKRDIDDFLDQRRDNDIVACWSSPPCTAFSRANTTGVRDIRGGTRNVKAGLRIMRYCKPNFWFQENPVGLLKDQPFMARLSKYINTCCYCMYGRPFKKPTNIWSNMPQLGLRRCDRKTPCKSKRKFGRHLVTAQSGASAKGWGCPTGLSHTESSRLPSLRPRHSCGGDVGSRCAQSVSPSHICRVKYLHVCCVRVRA